MDSHFHGNDTQDKKGEEGDGLDESNPYIRKKLKDKKQMNSIN